MHKRKSLKTKQQDKDTGPIQNLTKYQSENLKKFKTKTYIT